MKTLYKRKPAGGFSYLLLFIFMAILAVLGWFGYEKYLTMLADMQSMQARDSSHSEVVNRLKNTVTEQEKQILLQLEQSAQLRANLDLAEIELSGVGSKLDAVMNELNLTSEQAEIRAREVENRRRENESLRTQLLDTDIKISDLKSRFTVFEMKQEILFNEGDAALKEKGQQALSVLANIFRQFPDRQIAIQGHTDNQPIGSVTRKKFNSNWDLAANRAASAIDYLQNVEKIKPERMILVSYSEYRPVQSNDNEAGRANNRRIEVILMPADFDFFRQTTN